MSFNIVNTTVRQAVLESVIPRVAPSVINLSYSSAGTINFMTLYNPELEKALLFYVRENRTPEEYLSLQLMRVYRLGEIIWYYTRSLSHISGDLLALNTARVHFWKEVLRSVLTNKDLSKEVLEEYKKTRDSLRTEEEKKRQKELH